MNPTPSDLGRKNADIPINLVEQGRISLNPSTEEEFKHLLETDQRWYIVRNEQWHQLHFSMLF